MIDFIKFLSGKKGVIAVILTSINGYILAQGYIDQNTFLLIGAILSAIFGGASAATKLVYKAEAKARPLKNI